MNKLLVFSIIGIVLLVSSAILYVVLTPRSDETELNPATISQATDKEASTQPESEVDSSVAPDTRDGQYVDYSEEALLASSDTKLLFFHAPWCSQCRSIESSIKADGIPGGVTVFKIDYDSNQALRQKYGVTLQTTFVKVDNQGNKIESYVAYEEPVFSSVERELLR